MAKSIKTSLKSFEEYSSIIKSSRERFDILVSGLKKRKELPQNLEFAVAKVEAELESLESTLQEIIAPSSLEFVSETRTVLTASIGKVLPYFLVNFERLGLQCGVDGPLGDPTLVKELFESNLEITELLITRS